MGFYNLTGSITETQESAPGSELIVSEAYISGTSWTTSITFSTGIYAVYLSNLSSPSVSFSITHPTKGMYTKNLSIASYQNVLQYIDGDSQNIQISLSSTTSGSRYFQISKIRDV